MSIVRLNNCRNPVLDIKRDGYLAEEKEIRSNLLDGYKLAISKTKSLHSNLLFTTQHGRLILANVCRLVTYVDPTITNTNWRDLAMKLGYCDIDIKCISNLRGSVYDPTELLLQYFAANKKEGTIGAVLEALYELDFLPALHEAQKHIDGLLAEVEAGKGNLIQTPGGIDCNNAKYEGTDIVKAVNFKPFVPAIFDSLPSKEISNKILSYNNKREEERVQRAKPQTRARQLKKYCKYVMLTFASDGYPTAQKVAALLRGTTNKKGLPIGVLMLCDNDNQLLENPGKMIPDILLQMDFVIPILTEGYFSALKKPNPQARVIDECYVQYIHNILVTKYIHDRCMNTQVRPIIPSDLINDIIDKPEFVHNPMFSAAWKSDNEVQCLAENILKSRKNIYAF